MMSRILTLLIVFGFSGGLSSVRAEQVEMAKHCEANCGCIPCGCASISCDRAKEPFSPPRADVPPPPANEAVKAQ